MPSEWKEDPLWRGPYGGSAAINTDKVEEACEIRYPSRWIPILNKNLISDEFKIIDYIEIN